MQNLPYKSPLLFSAIVGFVFLIPLIILEVVNRMWKLQESFPFSVFIFTWTIQTAFIFILLPIIKKVKSGKSLTTSPLNLIVRVITLALLAYIWGGWIIDQWPCLMGVPNCD